MLNLPLSLLSILITVIAWGTYGILLHRGQDYLGHSSMRSFVGVGIAYFLIAVLVPVFLLGRKPEKGRWTVGGTIMSLFAGAVGALGALGVLLALDKGTPIFVMPLVFGFAPVINTIVTMLLGKTYRQMTPIFVVGLIMVALGAVGVLVTKPKPAKADDVAAAKQLNDGSNGRNESEEIDAQAKESKEDGAQDGEASKDEPKANVTSSNENQESAKREEAKKDDGTTSQSTWMILSVIMAAVCWGAYGPFLHIGQMKMGGSRLRPFLCVGISYFIIAVAAPLALLSSFPQSGAWTFLGITWSIAAGAAGAIGALGIIMAFNFGGKPVFVMPLVFGFAPVVNTLVSITIAKAFDQIKPEFLFCLGIVIAGAITVLIFAPKSKPHSAPHPPVESEATRPPIDVAQ